MSNIEVLKHPALRYSTFDIRYSILTPDMVRAYYEAREIANWFDGFVAAALASYLGQRQVQPAEVMPATVFGELTYGLLERTPGVFRAAQE